MEEDVEIEMLLKSNEKILMDAAKEEISRIKSKENEPLQNRLFNSVQVTKSSQNKENIVENMMADNEEILCQLNENTGKPEILSQDNESNGLSIFNQDVCNYNHNNISKNQNHVVSSVNDRIPQEVSCIESADDQLNQHMLDLIASGPMKYYLPQQNSYVSQFEEEDEEYISNEDDWDDVFGHKDNDFVEDMEESQIKSSQKSQFLGNRTELKVESKPIPALIVLGKMLMKRDSYLLTLENKLKQMSQENKDRRKELMDAMSGGRKIEDGEPNSSKCSFRKFGMPYFSDDKGFYPPPNKDHQLKLDNGEIMIESIPRINNWSKLHKEMMKNAIKKSLIEENSAKLITEIKKLKSMLHEASKNNHGNRNKLQNEITEKQNELKALSKKSFKDLVQSEKEDRNYDWMKFSVSLFDGLHSADDCKRFWDLYLKPSINKEAWSDSEDSKLSKIAAQLGYQNWEKIAQLLGTNRSAFQCFVHYKARIEGRNDISGGKWTEVEDKKLLTVVNSSKVGHFIPWTKISAYLHNRNHNQIYTRWANSLNPELVKGRFSKEEDLLIVSGIEVFGVNYKELALFMNNRSASQIRERYERHLLPKTAKVGTWSLEEDEKLLNLIQKYGERNWSKISDEMKTRTRTQVRQRYGFIQKMRKNKPGWTIAQVKRRKINDVNKSIKKTKQDVANIKRDIDEVERVFRLSKIEKQTFLFEKLSELRDKIESRKFGKRGRKKRGVADGSELNDAILDLFKSCYTLPKMTKSIHDDIDGKLNELTMLATFLGHKLQFPKSKEEVWDNPKLSFASKSFLIDVLNSNKEECSSRSSLNQQIHAGPCSSTKENNSVQNIDLPIPEHDDTIIMMDWWHTPPINVANLNFSEFFKRTVFDYSNGMHKDIWDSKVKRSHMINTGHHCSHNVVDELPPIQNHMFPPSLFTTLGKRSILLSRATLERQTREKHVLENIFCGDLKIEVDEDCGFDAALLKVDRDVINDVCKKFQENLIKLFTWPQVLSVTKIGSVLVDYAQCSQRKRAKLHGNLTSESGKVLGSVENEESDSSLKSNTTSQKEVVTEGFTEDNYKHHRKTEHFVMKRKLQSESVQTEKNKTHQRRKRVSKCVKRKVNHPQPALRKKNNSSDTNLSDVELSGSLESTSFTYSSVSKSKKRKFDNYSPGDQPKQSKYWSAQWQCSDTDD